MTIASLRRAPSGPILAFSLAVALLATTIPAFAETGYIESIAVTPGSVFVNDPVTVKLIVMGKKSLNEVCAASWSVRDSLNVEVEGGQANLVKDGIDEANYSHVFKIAKPGVYKVVGKQGLAQPGQKACDGTATTTLTVTAKVSSQPIEVKPPSTTPINRVNLIPKINPIPGNPGNPGALRKP